AVRMRVWLSSQTVAVIVHAITILMCLHCPPVTSLRKENRCMRHYFVETIRHPSKECENKNVLLARCEGYCGKSRTNPRVSFSPVLYHPFKHYCTCCTPTLSIMKAVALRCKDGKVVFATYRRVTSVNKGRRQRNQNTPIKSEQASNGFAQTCTSSADDIDTASTAIAAFSASYPPPSDNYGTLSSTPAHRNTRDDLTLNEAQDDDHTRGDVRDHVPLIDTPESSCEKYTSCRWTLAYLGSVLTLMVFCLRNCISMAIVCMSDLEGPRIVRPAPLSYDNGTNSSASAENGSDPAVLDGQNYSVVVVGPGPEYIPQSIQGVVLSAYYYGYILTPFLGGIVAAKFGGKRMLTISMAMSAVFTLLMPVAIRSNIYLTILLRILLGFVAGVTLPSSTLMWTQWAPTHEKAKLITVNFSGSSTGSIVANLVSGFLCSIPLDEGWPFIFYTYGAVAVVWVILWQFLAYDTPAKHPRTVMKPPLRAIFTSPPFYAMICAHMAYSWFINFVTTYLPLYLNDILAFDIQASGALSSLPFVARAILNMVFAVIADRLQTGGVMSITNNRKFFQTLGLVVPGAMLVGLGFLDPSQRYLSVVMFIVLAGIQSGCQLGFRLTPLDIAPRFAAPLAGLSVTFGTAAQIVCPLVTSAIIADVGYIHYLYALDGAVG
ncbi:hypothetical protein BaRGS_00024346, partial [Batillaria attramentaria]